ncbi:MAG: hypothetical protein ACI87J_002621 [Colwellia sp.]|jgi:hypothetical protein
MAKLKFSNIEVIFQEKRLDLATDYLLKLTIGESVSYAPMRLSKTHATSFYFENDSNIEKYFSIERKRTVKANIKALINQQAKIISKSTSCFFTLNSEDTTNRKRILLAKRKWKIHHVAKWSNGFFIARLSCTRSAEVGHQSTQFILYPALFQSLVNPKPNLSWECYTEHGSLRNSNRINARALVNAMHYESEWPDLSDALSNVEYGYNTEIEAKAGFDYVLSQQESPPHRVTKNNRQNSIKQKSINYSLDIHILDSYNNALEKAWLFRHNKQYFIMRMVGNSPNKIMLVGRGVSTVCITPLDSAHVLLSQLYQGEYVNEWDKEEAFQHWQEMIVRDVYYRYFSENINATWLVTKIATNNGIVVALLAECYPDSKLNIPEQFAPLTHRVIVVDEDQLKDPSKERNKLFVGRFDRAKFQRTCQELIEFNFDVFGNKFKEKHKELEDILVYTQGFALNDQATHYFEQVSHDSVHKIDGSACPINAQLKSDRFDVLQSKHRANLVKRIEEKKISELKLIEYDDYIVNFRKYPKQLIEFGLSKNLISLKESMGISTFDTEYCDDKRVDLFGNSNIGGINTGDIIVNFETPEAIATPMTNNLIINNRDDILVDLICNPKKDVINSDNVINKSNSKKEVNISDKSKTSTTKSNAGRKRIHVDERERKRVWAHNKRLAIKNNELALGIVPKVRGRKKRYSNAAEKEKAYRLRNKWKKLSLNSVIIVLLPENPTEKHRDLLSKISQITPYFEERALLISHGPNDDLENEVFSLNDNDSKTDIVYINKPRYFEENLLTKVYDNQSVVHICGCEIEQQGYIIAMALFNKSIPFIFHKSLILSGDISSVEKVFKLAFRKNTMQR